MHSTDVVIMGAGVSGLAAAASLGRRAVVLERDSRPGGLVQTDCYDGYWFDRVLHLLYFPDEETEHRVRPLLNDTLAPCPPEAWVETLAGAARFPFQLHLGTLEPEARDRCVAGLDAALARKAPAPTSFEDLLLQTFGEGMCEVFLLPYNRKQWKRPLSELASSGFTWNIAAPDREKVLEGARRPDARHRAYNSGGWYPRPPAGAEVRGMELLSRALAAETHDLRLRHTVTHLDVEARRVTAVTGSETLELGYESGCLATVALPALVRACPQVPPDLRERCLGLRSNRVLSGALSVRGSRPVGRGHWRYYADESLIFHRVAHMHEFDPLLAPPDGWGLLVEVAQRSEDPLDDERAILDRMAADARRAGLVGPSCEIVDANLSVVDPAYVLFTDDSAGAVADAIQWFREHDVEPMGRYGRWQYSSMAQVMRDGFAWADALESAHPAPEARA